MTSIPPPSQGSNASPPSGNSSASKEEDVKIFKEKDVSSGAAAASQSAAAKVQGLAGALQPNLSETLPKPLQNQVQANSAAAAKPAAFSVNDSVPLQSDKYPLILNCSRDQALKELNVQLHRDYKPTGTKLAGNPGDFLLREGSTKQSTILCYCSNVDGGFFEEETVIHEGKLYYRSLDENGMPRKEAKIPWILSDFTSFDAYIEHRKRVYGFNTCHTQNFSQAILADGQYVNKFAQEIVSGSAITNADIQQLELIASRCNKHLDLLIEKKAALEKQIAIAEDPVQGMYLFQYIPYYEMHLKGIKDQIVEVNIIAAKALRIGF